MTTPGYLTIAAEHHGHQTVLLAAGELDICNHEDLRRAIRAALDHHPPRDLTIDLTELGFTDCAGLSILVWAHERLAERGQRLTLTGVQPNVRRLLRLTSLDTRLHLAVGDDEATPQPDGAGEGSLSPAGRHAGRRAGTPLTMRRSASTA